MALKRLKWLKFLFINRLEAETEQNYWNEKRKKHLANEHSEGVVTGLSVIETSPPSLSVQIVAGRALDTEGNDPEVESPQEIDCTALVPAAGERVVYITLRYNTVETDPYFVDEIGASQNKFIQDSFVLEATTQVPTAPVLELARFRLGAGAIAIRNASDPTNPGLGEIDLRSVKRSGKEVLFLRDLFDVDPTEADAFNGMEAPSATNPVTTVSKADSLVAPMRSEVVTARGTRASLDARLDVMLNNDGSFKGIIKITPAAPLTGGGTAGDVPLGITDATPAARGAMSAADKAKLDGIEPGATADQTAEEILDLVKTVDGAGSALDADLLRGSPHRGFGGTEHPTATPSLDGFMSAADKSKLDGVAAGATRSPLTAAAPAQIDAGDVANPGTSVEAARADHSHPVNTGGNSDIQPVGTNNLGGASAALARADHVHALSPHNHESPGAGGQLDHGAALTGLGDDDHPQYTRADGGRPFSGHQSMGGFRLTNLAAPAAATDAATKAYADAAVGFKSAASLTVNSGTFTTGSGAFVAVPGTSLIFNLSAAGDVLIWASAKTFPTASGQTDTQMAIRVDGTDYPLPAFQCPFGNFVFAGVDGFVHLPGLAAGPHTVEMAIRQTLNSGIPAGLAFAALEPGRIAVLTKG